MVDYPMPTASVFSLVRSQFLWPAFGPYLRAVALLRIPAAHWRAGPRLPLRLTGRCLALRAHGCAVDGVS